MGTSREQLIMNLGSGHLGKHHSEQTKVKISEAKRGQHSSLATEFKKGQASWNKGKHLSDHWKYMISESLKRKGFRPQIRYGVKPWNKGNHLSEEIRAKLSESHKGHVASLGQRIKMSLAHSGERHWNWQGGVSEDDYGFTFPESLRETVRIRDNHTCQSCGKRQEDLNGGLTRLDIHHIDHDKMNSKILNLVSLCRACHIKIHKIDLRGNGSYQQPRK
jgi:hypothetical protein